jgi:hypothetical protein
VAEGDATMLATMGFLVHRELQRKLTPVEMTPTEPLTVESGTSARCGGAAFYSDAGMTNQFCGASDKTL